MNKTAYKKYLLEIANISNLAKEDTLNKFNNLLKEIFIPEKSKFYRYRPLNEYTIFEILQGYIFLSSPSSLNDPYDCNAYLSDTPLSISFSSNFIILKHEATESLNEEIKNLKKEELDSIISTGAMNYRKKTINEKLKISCFTTKNDNLSMWDHYANKHKGICIEYDFENIVYENNKLKCNGQEYEHELFLPVFYTPDFNQYLIGMGGNNLKRVSCLVNSILKHSNWKTEDEWRLISYDNDVTEFKGFPIKAIYFGTKTDDIVINKIIDLLKNDKRKIKFFKMYETTSGLRHTEIGIS